MVPLHAIIQWAALQKMNGEVQQAQDAAGNAFFALIALYLYSVSLVQ